MKPNHKYKIWSGTHKAKMGCIECILEEERLCPICLNGDIESKLHKLTECSAYYDLTKDLYASA